MTFEELLQKMLDKVPSNVDKREGSVIYDALAPCAYFLTEQKFLLEYFPDLVFPDTAEGAYLDLAAAPFGIVRKPAVRAVRKMETSKEIPLGSRWGIQDLVYCAEERLEDGSYKAVCEKAGEIGNQYSGIMQPISDLNGGSVTLSDIITAGTDQETDEAMRERFYAKVRLPATSGNAFHYQQWAMEVPGSGAAKVFPLDNGPGTVTVLVVDEDKAISSSLPETVAAYIETVRPIGASVTVESPEAQSIHLSASVLLDGTRQVEEVSAAYRQAVGEFLKELVFQSYRVSYGKLGSLLLEIPGVADFENFTLNGTAGNVILKEKQIPVLGTVELVEVSALETE